MKQYFDLVAASMIIRDAREIGVAINAAMHKLDLEWMVGFLDLPDEEKWQRLKEHFAGSPMGVIVMGGLIDFDPVEMARLEGARPTYDENLELQKAAIDTECVRVSHIPAYYDCEILESFKAQVAQIDKQSGKIRFWCVLVTGWYDGNQMFAPYEGNEYDISMDLKGFERYQAGDYLSFDAEVYRYIDTVATKEGETRIISFGLRNPKNIKRIEEASEELLKVDEDTAIQRSICGICNRQDYCNGIQCINEDWAKHLREALPETENI